MYFPLRSCAFLGFGALVSRGLSFGLVATYVERGQLRIPELWMGDLYLDVEIIFQKIMFGGLLTLLFGLFCKLTLQVVDSYIFLSAFLLSNVHDKSKACAIPATLGPMCAFTWYQCSRDSPCRPWRSCARLRMSALCVGDKILLPKTLRWWSQSESTIKKTIVLSRIFRCGSPQLPLTRRNPAPGNPQLDHVGSSGCDANNRWPPWHLWRFFAGASVCMVRIVLQDSPSDSVSKHYIQKFSGQSELVRREDQGTSKIKVTRRIEHNWTAMWICKTAKPETERSMKTTMHSGALGEMNSFGTWTLKAKP